MKKLLMLLSVTILCLTVVLCGCNDESTSPQATEASTEKQITKDSEKMLDDYFASFVEGKNPVYGTWQMDDFDYVSFIFRNDNKAEMCMGTEGSFSELTIDENEKTLKVSFILGLNGTYEYKMSKNNKIMTLTMNGSKTVLHKKDNYNFTPNKPKNPIIDKDILGWWKGKNEQVYYFGVDGLMYSNQISLETCYTYNAENGVISAIYDLGGEVTDNYDYKLTKSGKLKIKGDLYKPYNPFK